MRRLARAVAVAVLISSPALADDWAGKLVMFKEDEKRLGKKSGNGLTLDGKKLTANAVYKIRTDDGTFVELVSQTGWMFKSDVLPLDEAIKFFGEKIQSEPGKGKWYGRRGMARMNTGRNVVVLTAGGKPTPTLDASLADFTEALKTEPTVDRWWSERASCHYQRGEYDPAITDYSEAIRLKPNVAGYYSGRGIAYRTKKEFDLALADYSKSLEIDPKNAVTYNNRGMVWDDKKEYEKAIADLTESVKLNPKYAIAFDNRGNVHRRAKHWAEATADYKKAIELDPKYAAAFNSLAWQAATCPDAKLREGKAAVEWGKKAVELTPTSNTRNSLAAAYAEAGDFDQAVAEQTKALDNKNLSAAIRTAYQQRLELYKSKKPFHEN
jgi:tetratricopeptide (TPR) repeat protein